MIHKPWQAIEQFLPRLAQSTASRSKGLHLSELYSVMYPPKKSSTFTEADLALFAIGGFAVERVIELGLASLMQDIVPGVKRPGEIVSSEGIIGSPDLYFYEPDGEIIIGDIKAKWMSTKDVPREEGENEFSQSFDKMFCQLQGYLHIQSEIDGRFYNRGRLIVYFVNGNWRPTKPELLAWDLEWSRQEIEENWDAMISIARDIR